MHEGRIRPEVGQPFNEEFTHPAIESGQTGTAQRPRDAGRKNASRRVARS
jgi:hypothetical protein